MAWSLAHVDLVERLLGAKEKWEAVSMIITPILAQDEVVGALVAGQTDEKPPKPWKISDLSLTAAVANLASSSLLPEKSGSS